MKITARAPASIGNVGVGFDILGAALEAIDDGPYLGDMVTVERDTVGSFLATGPFADLLPADVSTNLVLKAQDAFWEAGRDAPLARVGLHKGLPIGSGLGSSAASIVAGVVAFDAFFGTGLDGAELLRRMGALEGSVSGSVHYDNVGPAFHGGLQLLLDEGEHLVRELPVPDWTIVLLHPGTSVSTAAARAVMPDSYPRATAVDHGRRVAGFVHALHTGEHDLAARLMVDVLAEPWRKTLLPHLGPARAAAEDAGALATGISGSGPTVFAVAESFEDASRIRDAWTPLIAQPRGFVRIARIGRVGAAVEIDT